MISVFGFTINIEENARYLFDFYQENAMVSLLSSVNGTASFLFPALCSALLLMFATSKKNFFAAMLSEDRLTAEELEQLKDMVNQMK